MGCGSSKNQVHVSSAGTIVDNTNNNTITNKPPLNKSNKTVTPSAQSRNRSGRSRHSEWDGSTSSLRSHNDIRGGSATSKASKHSCDSGFDDEGRIVTEGSHPERVKEVEEEFQSPRELDLGVVGRACPQRLSAKDKERQDEQRVMASLQNEGLIARPMSRAAFGVSFEVVQADETGGVLLARRPPARLAKLEKRKKKRNLTEEELEAKLARAEERRKAKEQQRLARIQAVTMKSDVTNALEAFATRQEEVKTEVQTKDDKALENREKKLKEMRDKLKAKQDHAEKVRQRKGLVAMEGTTHQEENEVLLKSRRFTEDTPVGVSQ